jgi:hypothetical protein
MANTITKTIDGSWTQVTTQTDWLIQIKYTLSGVEIIYSGTQPVPEAEGIEMNDFDILSSGILPGTIWAKSKQSVSTIVVSE